MTNLGNVSCQVQSLAKVVSQRLVVLRFKVLLYTRKVKIDNLLNGQIMLIKFNYTGILVPRRLNDLSRYPWQNDVKSIKLNYSH